ncbi:MAG: EAL domain-containing protein [Pseudomonadota bacterium]
MPAPSQVTKRTLSLSQQTMLLLCGFALLASLVVGMAFYHVQRQDLLAHQREGIDNLLNRAQDTLATPVEGLGGDILLLAELHAARMLAGGACQDESSLEAGERCGALERLADIFEALLRTHPEYIQVRLIGQAYNGRELLRLDRRHGEVVRIPPAELQAKGDRPYVRETLALPKGSLYLSPVDLNQEHGGIEVPHNPVLRMATPLYSSTGAVFGLLVVNLAYGPVLERVSALSPRDAQLYVTNNQGDLLLAPERELSFGFDLGQRHFIQDRYPELSPWLKGHDEPHLTNDQRLIGARRIELHPAWPNRALSVFAVQPMDSLTDELDTTLWHSVAVSAALMLLGLLLALLTTRGLSLDLRLLTQAARRFAKGDITPAVPRSGCREVRELGEAFSAMRAEVIERDASLRDQEAYLRTIIDTSTEGIITVDSHGLMKTVNPVAAKMFGHRVEDMLGESINMLMPSRYASEHDRFLLKPNILRGEKPLIGRTVLGLRKDGSTFPISIGLASFERNGERMFTAFIQDVGALQAAEEAIRQAREIESLAYFDPLTKLANRLRLRERLAAMLTTDASSDARMALVIIDLDGFKDVNDRLGHGAGDRLLITIANRMRELVHGQDLVARLGGDEFAILFPGLGDPRELRLPLVNLLKKLSEEVQLGEHTVRVSASMGVSFFPDDAETLEDLFRHADIAMYRAKAGGRNQYAVFSQAMEAEIIQRHTLRRRLADAMENEQLELYYQPQANMGSGHITSVEALIRWNDPEHGLRAPSIFIPLAEESDLIIRIGIWVMRTALRQIETWNRQGLRMEVAVNIAARQFQDARFVDTLRSLLAEHPEVTPGQLKLEITESAAMADFDQARRIILECRELGVLFALDDFGTGFSSLTYLQKLPVQSLKIDRSFIANLLRDANDAAITKGIIDMARLLNLSVIAEGVEDERVINRLLDFGCRLGQGYGIARPMPAAALALWMERWQRPPAWKTIPDWSPNEQHFGLMFARQAHEDWLNHLLEWVETGHADSPPDSLAKDETACAFAHWCEGPGEEIYGGRSGFGHLLEVHHAIHEIGALMIEHVAQGRRDEARAMIHQLLDRRDALFDALEALKLPVH